MTRKRGRAERRASDPVRLANHRVAFIGHAVVWASVGLLLGITAGWRAAAIVMTAWAILLSAHGFFAVVAPLLHARWVAEGALAARSRALALPAPRDARAVEALAAAVAHEIRNPITAAKSLMQQVRDDPSAADAAELSQVAIDELDRVERSVTHLLRYAREEPLSLAAVELGAVVTAAIDEIAPRAEAAEVKIERELPDGVVLRADSDKIRRVLTNLVSNAIDAVALRPRERGAGVVHVRAGSDLAGENAWVRVEDNGLGVEPSQRDRIFLPFVTSKEKGTGLGLAIARKLVEAHGGSLVLEDKHDGAAFVLTLPIAPEVV